VSRLRLAGLVLAVAALAGVGVGLIVSLVAGRAEAGPALPKLHGQESWSPGERRAPGFALRDQNGALVSLASLRQRPVLLTFLDSRCRSRCPLEGRMLSTMLRGMAPSARPTLLIVGVNPQGDTPASIRHAAAHWRLAGAWRWHWLHGTRRELAPLWRAYGITVEPTSNDITHGMALYLIGGRGFKRTAYLFPFLPNFVALDLQTLARQQA
jgi:protein SCO1/2